MTPDELRQRLKSEPTETTQEAAHRLGVTEEAILKWVERDHLTSIIPGAKPQRYFMADVDRAQVNRDNPKNRATRRALRRFNASD